MVDFRVWVELERKNSKAFIRLDPPRSRPGDKDYRASILFERVGGKAGKENKPIRCVVK